MELNWDGRKRWRIRFQVGEARSNKKVQRNPVAVSLSRSFCSLVVVVVLLVTSTSCIARHSVLGPDSWQCDATGSTHELGNYGGPMLCY